MTTSHKNAQGGGGAPRKLTPPDGIDPAIWDTLADADGDRWRIVERDGDGAKVGVSLRFPDGRKSNVPGGRRGLIYPEGSIDAYAGSTAQDPVVVAEGASDTAAALQLGFTAVGVPMAGACGDELARLLKDRHVVIVEDADRAGRLGAKKIADRIVKEVASLRVIAPPRNSKDLRQAVIDGATAEDLRGLIDSAPLYGDAPPEAEQPDDDPEPFDPVSADMLIASNPELRPVVVDGLLRRGEVMNVIAAPKARKSWLMLSLATAAASGGWWLGRRVTRCRVLVVDGELHRETIARRLVAVAGSPSAEALKDLDIWPLRGRRVDINTIADKLARIEPERYGLIVVDPLYKLLPSTADENSNSDIGQVYKTLDRIAETHRAAVALVHHSAKGWGGDKTATDIGAGAGAQSRAADVHLALRPHAERDALVVDPVVRSFAPVEPFCVRWGGAAFEVAKDLDPTDILKPGRRQREPGTTDADDRPRAPLWTPERFAAEVVGPFPIIAADVLARGVAAGLKRSAADDLLKRGLANQCIERINPGNNQPHRFRVAESKGG